MINLDSCALDEILPVRRTLRRELASREGLHDLRVAVLGGSTTSQLVNMLDVLLLASGFRPVFHEGEYGRFYDEAVHDSQALIEFRPDIVMVYTSFLNLRSTPPVHASEEDLERCIAAEMDRFKAIWDGLEAKLNCPVVQNNFELPPYALLGNMDAARAGGAGRFVVEMNLAFAREANARQGLFLQDVHGLSARMGLENWFDWDRYFSYKLLLRPEANLRLARSLTATVRAIYGMSRKVLVLDLDNTLWGGVIGDEGCDRIRIGRETPEAEAYTAFQEYCLRLRERGVLLAVCSKNEDAAARSGFAHPDSILKLEHISCFKANWLPKHENLLSIAKELNLGVDSLVFVDDNPAERAIVRAQLPQVAVPEVGSEVAGFIGVIDAGRYFETVGLSAEDFVRASQYAQNARRTEQLSKFASYEEFLDSLEMSAEIDAFKPVYIERIAQLTNKTNQFNLTTRRYTLPEIEAAARDRNVVTLYGKLSDSFGDHGLISVIIGRCEGDVMEIDLWLMSCRVLKRNMECAMLDALVGRARERGVRTLRGSYIPSAKNMMVRDHYASLGFAAAGADESGASFWTLDLSDYEKRDSHIAVMEVAHA